MFNFSDQSPDFTADDSARLRRIERKLDLILGHLGLADAEPEAGFPEQARVLAARGDKIGAIGAYREGTGAGLADAKRAVEGYLGGRPGRAG